LQKGRCESSFVLFKDKKKTSVSGGGKIGPLSGVVEMGKSGRKF